MMIREKRAPLTRPHAGVQPKILPLSAVRKLRGQVGGEEARAAAAWQAWLRAMATDTEAAVAAALAYESLDDAGRDTWLEALEQDAPRVGVPKIALYAPLLSVEKDEERLFRIRLTLGELEAEAQAPVEARALRGVGPDGDRFVVLVLPLYLSFVQLLTCRYHPSKGFSWARHEPFCLDNNAPKSGDLFEGVELERTPMKPVIEELAHAVVAHGRTGAQPPEALRALVDLFSPSMDPIG